MRPIALDMHGFACFRVPTRIDFTDADFFALVGPTGSGKSTVIDAMTFALYGSVPRWGRKGMISLALAPTTARGTVKLVFEVDGQRYVIAREVRRAGSQISQRAATLERLGPHGTAEVGEATDLLAKDPAGVSDAVERLLGLSYEDFCQCVVLPQGQFAAFLHVKPSERQAILLRLLGAEHYRQMMERANQRSSFATQRVNALNENLANYAVATQEAENAARAPERALEALNERVAAALPEIHAANEELVASDTHLARLEQERTALAEVHIPQDVAALDANLIRVRTTLETARSAEEQAERADAEARQALADGPQRAPLELVRQHRDEHAQRTARLPSARDEAARQAAVSRQAETAGMEGESALEELRVQRDEAARGVETAERREEQLSAEHATLTAVAVLEGVDLLDKRTRTATEVLKEAREALETAERNDNDARAAVESAVQIGPLEQALRDLRELQDLGSGLAQAEEGLTQTLASVTSANAVLHAAESQREQHQRRLDEARRAHVAADLRTHLVVGEPCPVCEQTVTTLPAALDATAVDDAQSRVQQADAAVRSAQKAVAAADSAGVKAVAELQSLKTQRGRHITSLTTAMAAPLSGASPLTAIADFLNHDAESESPSTCAALRQERQAQLIVSALVQVEQRLEARRNLESRAREAAAALTAARGRVRSAESSMEAIEADAVAAWNALRAARDPLVGLGAPSVDDMGLAAAWNGVATWAADQARARAEDLAAAREALKSTRTQLESAQERFGQAESRLAELRAEATKAARAEQEANTRLSELTSRISELDQLLADAPDEAELAAQLALRDSLEAAASDAERRLLEARSSRGRTERELAEQERAEAAARAQLLAARDPLVRLGAPAVENASILAAWTTLENWASREASSREKDIPRARDKVAAARSTVGSLTSRLSADLTAAGVEITPAAVATEASTAVAKAVERAHAATGRIVERRAEAADLAAKRDAAAEEHDVAKMLGDLLRSDKFQRWLVTAAVDTLVEHASRNLAELSSGQFDLTHEDGDFYVIDHTDADSRRSVRTLSGGETFQASLALALALSSQISALAAAGAARLDSIFLDEGFGTLDPDTLDIVATTLETLAQGQRMVGVVTHVTALAERVPVRFRVFRDTRTSTVIREGITQSEGAA